jgi:hypothetical protein
MTEGDRGSVPEHSRLLDVLVVVDVPHKLLVRANEMNSILGRLMIDAEILCGPLRSQRPSKVFLLIEHPLVMVTVQYLSGGWWLVARIHAGWHPDDTRSR